MRTKTEIGNVSLYLFWSLLKIPRFFSFTGNCKQKIWLKQPKAASALDFSYFQHVSKLVTHDTKTAVFLSKTAVFFGPMAKFRRYGRICVVICLRISYNHAMGRETGRATGGRLLSGTDQRHRFPVRISGRRYAGGGHAAVRLAAPVGAGVCLYLRGNDRAFVGR